MSRVTEVADMPSDRWDLGRSLSNLLPKAGLALGSDQGAQGFVHPVLDSLPPGMETTQPLWVT